MKKKHLHTQKNPGISTEGAYSELLPALFVMPQSGIMSARVKENIESERMPRSDSFTPFYCGNIADGSAICNGCKLWII